MNPDDQEILSTHTTWIDAVNAGDLARLMTMITDDVVMLGPGQSPFGSERFRQNFLSATQRLEFHCVSELEEVVVVGDIAYARSKDSLKVAPKSGGDTVRLAGDRLTIYRRQPDGRWLLARDAHTLTVVKD